jgi:hypothetical protein
VKPEPLIRLLPDYVFDDPREVLGIDQYVIIFITCAVDLHLFFNNQPVFAVFQPEDVARDHRSIRVQRKECQPIGCTGGPFEKIHKHPFLPSHILIHHNADNLVLSPQAAAEGFYMIAGQTPTQKLVHEQTHQDDIAFLLKVETAHQ